MTGVRLFHCDGGYDTGPLCLIGLAKAVLCVHELKN